MLRVCTEHEYASLVDFVYALALDRTKAGYPSYSDGMKTREMFEERSRKAFSRDNEEILLFEYDGAVEGWIHYYALPADDYLSTVSFSILSHTEQALAEFLEYAGEHYRGYELYLGYSIENTKAISFLEHNGFVCIEKSYNNTVFFDRYRPLAADDRVVRITRENYESFRVLHSSVEGDMYWNSDRIYADIDNWMILVRLRNGEPAGSVYYITDDDGWFEIFGIDLIDGVFDADVFYGLLSAALNTAKECGGKYMTFFCGEEEQKIVSRVGFECIDQYVCYKKRIGASL